jgi:hypothetical protein
MASLWAIRLWKKHRWCADDYTCSGYLCVVMLDAFLHLVLHATRDESALPSFSDSLYIFAVSMIALGIVPARVARVELGFAQVNI